MLVGVPINTDQQGWSVLAPPSDWARVRDRWQIAHLIRTTTAVCAFITLVAAAITPAPPGARRAQGAGTATALIRPTRRHRLRDAGNGSNESLPIFGHASD